MSDLDRRWERLADAARRRPPPASAPAAAWVERMARRGVLARAVGRPRAPERLAWMGLATLAAAGAAAVLLFPGPIFSSVDGVAARVLSLPRELPHAPRLPPAPVAPRPALPPAQSALAAVARWPGLTLDFPFTSRRTETP